MQSNDPKQSLTSSPDCNRQADYLCDPGSPLEKEKQRPRFTCGQSSSAFSKFEKSTAGEDTNQGPSGEDERKKLGKVDCSTDNADKQQKLSARIDGSIKDSTKLTGWGDESNRLRSDKLSSIYALEEQKEIECDRILACNPGPNTLSSGFRKNREVSKLSKMSASHSWNKTPVRQTGFSRCHSWPPAGPEQNLKPEEDAPEHSPKQPIHSSVKGIVFPSNLGGSVQLPTRTSPLCTPPCMPLDTTTEEDAVKTAIVPISLSPILGLSLLGQTEFSGTHQPLLSLLDVCLSASGSEMESPVEDFGYDSSNRQSPVAPTEGGGTYDQIGEDEKSDNVF